MFISMMLIVSSTRISMFIALAMFAVLGPPRLGALRRGVRNLPHLILGVTILGGCAVPIRPSHLAPEAPVLRAALVPAVASVERTVEERTLEEGSSRERGVRESSEEHREAGAAQSAPEARVDTLDGLRRQAFEGNRKLRALFYAWQAQSERATQARALPSPRLSYTEFLEEIETRTGPQERRFGIHQRIPWPGKLKAAGSVEETATAAAHQRFEVARLALDQSVRTAFAEHYFVGRSIAITEASTSLFRQTESVARKKLAAGRETYSTVVRFQIELQRLEDRLASLKEQEAAQRARLNALLDRPADAPLTPATTLEPAPLELDRVTLLERLQDANPQLRLLEKETEAARLRRRLATQGYFPDFVVGIETIRTGSARTPGVPDSGKDPWLLTFQLELPFWWQKNRAQTREAEARWEARRHQRQEGENQLLAELEEALADLRDAMRRLQLFERDLVPKAEGSRNSLKTSYQTATANYLDVIDAERVLLDLQLSAERARTDAFTARAKIDRLTGASPTFHTSQVENRS